VRTPAPIETGGKVTSAASALSAGAANSAVPMTTVLSCRRLGDEGFDFIEFSFE
jgi:hypothetical protein